MAGTKAKKKSSSSSKKLKASDRIRILAPPAELNPNEDDLPVYLPGMPMEEGEELQADPSTYVMLHGLNAGWPCLSFAVCRDGQGEGREAFPASAIVCAGTQADVPSRNEVMLMRWTGLGKTLVESDSEGEDGDEEAEGERSSHVPQSTVVSWAHQGGVNRVRWHQPSGLVATWSDVGKVFVWPAAEPLAKLDGGQVEAGSVLRLEIKPTQKLAHATEGFALDWHAREAQLLSGDCRGHIMLSDAASLQGGSTLLGQHAASVEDLQWSPRGDTCFASASADGSIALWDSRQPGACTGRLDRAHSSDVNVISWNALSEHLLASGGDDGVINVWDLRQLSNKANAAQPAISHKWHRDAITSIEWSPHDAACLVASGADHQVTLWDFSAEPLDNASHNEVPAHLLFIHQGQRDIKEVHWHPQMPGTVISTAADGFNIFRTISI